MTYTHGHDESVLRSHTWRTVENSAAYLLPHLVPGASLLDVGCGPGTITADFAGRVAPGRVVGLDASADVIETARAAHGDAVEFTTGDVYALEVKISGADLQAAQKLSHCAQDAGARRAWIISQAKGTDPLLPDVARRGFDEVIGWLPQ